MHKSTGCVCVSVCVCVYVCVYAQVDALKWVYREMRKKELAMERKQKLIEQRADWGLDGPRPCMYMGGKRV